jgi:hypothetical protein
MRTRSYLTAAVVATIASTGWAGEEWIARSNEYANEALVIQAQYFPEFAGQVGLDGYDEEIRDLRPGFVQRQRADSEKLLVRYAKLLEEEKDARVRQDLGIMIQAARDGVRSSELEEQYMLPYFNIGQSMFFAVQGTLDPQNDASRRPSVVVRLRRYAGLEEGYEPIVELAKARTLEGLANPNLIGPFVAELDDHVEKMPRFIGGMQGLLAESGVEGWEHPFDVLSGQLKEYYAWLDTEMRPRARPEPQLPPAIYADNLKNFGVDVSPEELIERATLAFANIQNEMQSLARQVAHEKGYGVSDYRDVIAALKEERIPGDEVVAFYKKTLAQLEEIIEREHLVTLPERDADIQIASEARSAAQPAPHLKPPRLIGNTGEYPIFMIPTIGKNEDGSWQHNDTTFKSNAWTLTAHEARPGHELQFSSMIESGVSTARGIFAFNSVNVEGWALYAEAISRPYMPLDAQLISLQNRLLRAGRMFLDPMLNLGLLTREEVKEVLMTDVVIDEGFAQQEVDRYSFRAPGQATSYYFGFSHLQSLRAQVELKLRERFDAQKLHDFILAQGLMPPKLVKQAVMEEFVVATLAEAEAQPEAAAAR